MYPAPHQTQVTLRAPLPSAGSLRERSCLCRRARVAGTALGLPSRSRCIYCGWCIYIYTDKNGIEYNAYKELGHPDALVDRVGISSIHLGICYIFNECTLTIACMIEHNNMGGKRTCSVPRFIHLLEASTPSVPAGATDYQQYVNHHTKNVYASSNGQHMGAFSWTLSFMQQFHSTHTRIYFILYIHVTNPSPVSHIYIHFDLSISIHL